MAVAWASAGWYLKGGSECAAVVPHLVQPAACGGTSNASRALEAAVERAAVTYSMPRDAAAAFVGQCALHQRAVESLIQAGASGTRLAVQLYRRGVAVLVNAHSLEDAAVVVRAFGADPAYLASMVGGWGRSTPITLPPVPGMSPPVQMMVCNPCELESIRQFVDVFKQHYRTLDVLLLVDDVVLSAIGILVVRVGQHAQRHRLLRGDRLLGDTHAVCPAAVAAVVADAAALTRLRAPLCRAREDVRRPGRHRDSARDELLLGGL